MTIAIIINSSFPGPGAANQAVHMQAIGLSFYGVWPTVIANRQGMSDTIRPEYDVSGPSGTGCVPPQMGGMARRIVDGYLLMCQTVASIYRRQYSWIMFYGVSPFFVLPSALAAIVGQKVCYIQYDLQRECVRVSPMQWLFRRVLELSERVVVRASSAVLIGPSSALEGRIRKISASVPLLKVWPPTDATLFGGGCASRARGRLSLREDELLVVCCGSLSTLEGTPMLLKAFQTIVQSHPAAKLVLTGRTSDFDPALGKPLNYELLAKELGIMRQVVFDGMRTRGEVADLLAAANCLVVSKISHPANDAASPIKIGEYLACGRPIVSSRVCGLDQWLDNEQDVLFFNPGSVEGLIECVNKVLRGEVPGLGRRGPGIAQAVCDYKSWGKVVVPFLMNVRMSKQPAYRNPSVKPPCMN